MVFSSRSPDLGCHSNVLYGCTKNRFLQCAMRQQQKMQLGSVSNETDREHKANIFLLETVLSHFVFVYDLTFFFYFVTTYKVCIKYAEWTK